MDNEIMTIKHLSEILNSLVENGCGDKQIFLENEERPLYIDEFSYQYNSDVKCIEIRRKIWHDKYVDKVINLKKDIKKSIDKFYGLED